MAQHEMREIASYLRNGSLWVGHFVVSNGELDFGDDRFDAAHGLANFVCAEPTSSTNGADPQVQAWNRSADQTGGDKTARVPNLGAMVERLKLAA
jgi:hypothetical protein